MLFGVMFGDVKAALREGEFRKKKEASGLCLLLPDILLMWRLGLFCLCFGLRFGRDHTAND